METTSTEFKLFVSGEWESGVKTNIQIRHFPTLILDDTEELDGKDEGPNPLELILASLNGCNGIMIPLIAKELNFTFSQLNFESTGAIDIRGFMGESSIRTHFQNINYVIKIHTSETNERLQELKSEVEKRNPIINLLADAQINLTSKWIKI